MKKTGLRVIWWGLEGGGRSDVEDGEGEGERSTLRNLKKGGKKSAKGESEKLFSFTMW
jgi:hypothetical protein